MWTWMNIVDRRGNRHTKSEKTTRFVEHEKSYRIINGCKLTNNQLKFSGSKREQTSILSVIHKKLLKFSDRI